MTQKTKSARRALRIDADHLFIGLIVLFVLTLAYIEYDKHQRTQAAAEVARNGEGEVLKLFRAWKFDQLQGDKVMLWSPSPIACLFCFGLCGMVPVSSAGSS